MSSKRLLGAIVGLLACVAVPATVVASSAPAEAAGSNTLTVSAGEYTYSLKGSPKAGNVQLDFVNGGVEYHMMAMVKLKKGVTNAQLKKAALSDDDNALAKIADGDGQVAPVPGLLAPNEHMSMITKLAAGHYGLLCFIPAPEDGAPHAAHGMIKVFDVSGSKSSLTPPSDGVVDVTLTDTATTLPSTGIPSTGWVKITNNGSTVRDLNLATLVGSTTVQQADDFYTSFFESGSLPAGTAPTALIGGVLALPKGATTYLALDALKGRYVFASSNSDLDDDPNEILTEFTVK
jgi:hypothetical protein